MGAQLWRTGPDSRDKWENMLIVIDYNAELHKYAGPNAWNDMCMLSVGMYGKGETRWIKGTGSTDIEYQTQMSIWSIMAAPLTASCDLRNMNESTKQILMNEEVIAVNQDTLGKQAQRIINNDTWNVFVKPLSNGDHVVAILNRSEDSHNYQINFEDIGLPDKYEIRDLWEHEVTDKGKKWQGQILGHETKLFRLKRIK